MQEGKCIRQFTRFSLLARILCRDRNVSREPFDSPWLAKSALQFSGWSNIPTACAECYWFDYLRWTRVIFTAGITSVSITNFILSSHC